MTSSFAIVKYGYGSTCKKYFDMIEFPGHQTLQCLWKIAYHTVKYRLLTLNHFVVGLVCKRAREVGNVDAGG